MTDWKPVNPCTPDCKSRDSYCPPRNRFGCDSYEIYQGAIDAQRKLLEWLDEPCGKHWVPELRYRRHCDKCWAELKGEI
jgi:hypothetical protein